MRDPEADEIFDTAYTNMELKPHTDCTYYRDTPALQFFNCEHPSMDKAGGQTVLVDGFAVAASLRDTDRDVFDFFVSGGFRRVLAKTYTTAHHRPPPPTTAHHSLLTTKVPNAASVPLHRARRPP